MSDFRDLYRRTYADLGRPLTPRDGNAESRIEPDIERVCKYLLDYKFPTDMLGKLATSPC